MQLEQKMLIIENLLQDLILLVSRIEQAVDPIQAKSFRVNCREMGKQVYQLSQMLESLLCFITLDPILLYSNQIHFVFSRVSRILEETLNLACKCKRKTIFCRLFTGTEITSFHNLYHLFDVCFTNRNWLLIIYKKDIGSALDEIFASLPQILSNDSSIPLAWSCVVTENMIWELADMLTSEGTSPLNSWMIKDMEAEHGELEFNCLMAIMEIAAAAAAAAAESDLDLRCKSFKTKAIFEQPLRVIKESEDPTLQVLAIKSIGCFGRIFYESENHLVISALVSRLGNEQQEEATQALVALKKFACRTRVHWMMQPAMDDNHLMIRTSIKIHFSLQWHPLEAEARRMERQAALSRLSFSWP